MQIASEDLLKDTMISFYIIFQHQKCLTVNPMLHSSTRTTAAHAQTRTSPEHVLLFN
jgi:hypothetical protein